MDSSERNNDLLLKPSSPYEKVMKALLSHYRASGVTIKSFKAGTCKLDI